jgi:hypothetical protein
MHACMHLIGMFDVFVCYMHACMHLIDMFDVFVDICMYWMCLRLYIYIYICIYNFEMHEIKEKQIKKKILWGLCRAFAHCKGPYTHGKAPTWHPPVRPGSWLGMLPRPLPCEPAPGHKAKGQPRRTTTHHARLSSGPRQRRYARQREKAHGKGPTLGNVSSARQRLRARQKGKTHGNAS